MVVKTRCGLFDGQEGFEVRNGNVLTVGVIEKDTFINVGHLVSEVVERLGSSPSWQSSWGLWPMDVISSHGKDHCDQGRSLSNPWPLAIPKL